MPRRKRPHHRWTPEQLDILRHHYSTHTHQWLADQVGHSRVSVSRQLQIMGLRKQSILPAAPPGMKICSSCGGDPQPWANFYQRKAAKDGYASCCKRCMIKKTVEWNQSHSEEFRRNKQRHMLLKRYGLSSETYALLMVVQDNRCPICQQLLDLRVAVDHDHRTEAVRGILCANCNGGLGMLGDSIANLERALTYLRAAEAQQSAVSVTEAARILGLDHHGVAQRIRQGRIHAIKITGQRGVDRWRITLPELQRFMDRRASQQAS